MSSWFSRRRDKDKDKDKTVKITRSRSKSVDALPRVHHSTLVLSSSPPPPPPPPATLPPRTAIRFVSSSGLPVIPASNAPSRAASPAPPVLPPPVLPPPISLTFRPTASHRPGSSSGFRRAFATTRPRGTGPTPPPPPPSRTQPQRPATSSGAPAAESFLRQGLSRYGVGSFASLGTSSSFSLAPVPSHSASTSPSHSPPGSPLPPRSRPPQQPQPSPANLRKAARLRGFILKDGKRHHPRPREEAPYPRNYERKVLDHDVWELAFSRQLAGSNTFHKFPTPPARVLDLGCGTGSWILDSAREWPNTLFTGLDLVPIQPDPAMLGLDARVTWITANFLEPLPFPDGAFSFVHVRRVARGVPEHRWGSLMEEVARVLEPGGALEVIEEDLFFPGTEWVGDEDEDNESSSSGDGTRSRSGSTAASQKTLPKEQQPQQHNGCTRPHRPRGHTVLAEASDDGSSDSDLDHADHCPAAHAHSPYSDPRDHSLLARAYAELHAARFINLAPLAVLHSALVQYFRNVRSQPPLQLSFPPQPSDSSATLTSSTTSAPTPAPLLLPTLLTPTTHKHLFSFDAAAPGALLPQARCSIDATSLHLHLSARVTEVLACAEEMWDMLQQQEKQQEKQKQRGGEGDGNGNGTAVAEAPTREEWDDALSRFEMDMQDRIALGPLLTGRFAWHDPQPRPTGKHPRGAKSGARAAFDEAVRRWEQEQQRLRRRNGAAGAGGGAARKGVPLSRRLRVFIAWKDG